MAKSFNSAYAGENDKDHRNTRTGQTSATATARGTNRKRGKKLEPHREPKYRHNISTYMEE